MRYTTAIWKVVATVQFLKAENNTPYIFHISVKDYICSFNWRYFQLILSRLYKVIAPCKDCLYSESRYIFDYFW